MRKAITFDPTHLATCLYHGVEVPVLPTAKSEIAAAGLKLYSPSASYTENPDPRSWEARVTRALQTGENIWVFGPAGGGKNQYFREYAARTGRPTLEISFKEGASATSTIRRQDLRPQDGVVASVFEDGMLAKACKGVQIERGGEVITIPSLIVLSDADRYSGEDMEAIREALEIATGSGYLTCPITGELIPVAKGTQFVATANSGVDGDPSGGMLTQPIDASIGNRFGVGVQTPAPTEEWEIDLLARAFGVERAEESTSKKSKVKLSPSEGSRLFSRDGEWIGGHQPTEAELKVIVAAQRAARKAGEQMMICGYSVSVRTCLALTKLYRVNLACFGEGNRKLAMELACEDVLVGKLYEKGNIEAIKASYIALLDSLVADEAPKGSGSVGGGSISPCDR